MRYDVAVACVEDCEALNAYYPARYRYTVARDTLNICDVDDRDALVAEAVRLGGVGVIDFPPPSFVCRFAPASSFSRRPDLAAFALSHISCVLVCLIERFISYKSAYQRSRGHQTVVTVLA